MEMGKPKKATLLFQLNLHQKQSFILVKLTISTEEEKPKKKSTWLKFSHGNKRRKIYLKGSFYSSVFSPIYTIFNVINTIQTNILFEFHQYLTEGRGGGETFLKTM